MKTTLLLFFFLVILSVFSCNLFNPEEEPPEDPKASGLYECFINGEPFIARGPSYENQFSANPKTRFTEIADDFQFSISNRTNEQNLKIASQIEKKIGIYELYFGEFIDLSRDECIETFTYNLISDTTNYLNVTFIDTEHEFIAAEFECFLVNECINDTLHVIGHLERDYTP